MHPFKQLSYRTGLLLLLLLPAALARRLPGGAGSYAVTTGHTWGLRKRGLRKLDTRSEGPR